MKNLLSVISAAGLTIIAVFVIVSSAYEFMLPTHERSFIHRIRTGDTAWSIANEYYPAGKTSLCFDEFRYIVADQIKEQTGVQNLKNIQSGKTIKVVWQDKVKP